jgi:CBS domain-containing protein
MKVSDVMTRKVVSISPSAKISEAIKLMLKHKISGLPVVDGKGRPVGILTEGDLLRRPEIGAERRRTR